MESTGLPKIGSGDWNDGLSSVGTKGIGESVWLGFFVYDVLNRFIPIMKKYEEINNIVENSSVNVSKIEKETIKNMNKYTTQKYEKCLVSLKKALNSSGWDGRWYKRAYTDDGDELRKFKK